MSEPTLASSPSPFLRHGAEQPVDWVPWGVAAFARARELDRPVLLDIGAVWCHWCHVMDRESYEDPATAALINELYVPVKVDRDERPDVDARYQRAVQSLVGQGGWPLTGFLTPAGDVFHGGTYFPPEDAHGRPSFRRVLREVARVWAEERDRVEEAADAIRQRLRVVLTGEAAAGELDARLVDDAVDALRSSYDPRNGGFGSAPKFPNPGGLALLLDVEAESSGAAAGAGAPPVRRVLEHTLAAMADGGLYDQLGGGFHRYSTDARWIIPHFEKMAYDNGPLLELYARAAVALDDPRHEEVARGIVAHYLDVAPDLVEEGGFPASQDADIGFDDDGDYWTWTEAEVRDALTAEGSEDAVEPALMHWGVRDPAGAMHLDPSRHVLFRAATPAEVGRRLDRPVGEVRDLLDGAAAALRAARKARAAPYVDHSLFSGWVGLVASGHLAAARHLELEEAGRAALRALERVWREAWEPGRGLVHRLSDSATGVHLADQAHVAQALLDAFEWSQDPEWLERAGLLAEVIRRRFAHPSGGLQDVPSDERAEAGGPAGGGGPGEAVDLLKEGRLEITDSPEPSPTAVAAMSLARLAALRDDGAAADAAAGILRAYARSAPRFAASAATYFRALRWVVRPVTTVVVVEEPGADGGHGPVLRAALRVYRPETVVRRLEPGAVDRDRLPEALRSMVTGESPRAYVCAGRTCAPPVAEAGALADLLRTWRG